jgi:polyprenyl-phospho-N-acetylgalactosaminyl synthase
MLTSVTIAVLMPAFDEGEALSRTLSSLADVAQDAGGIIVFLIDDGSAVPVGPDEIPSATESFCVVLARHPINLGQGAALETARQLALGDSLQGRFSAFVTMDADGQHRPEDALALARVVEGGADVVFGDRFGGGSNMPAARRALLFFARLFERAVTGLSLSDAHNGLRAFSRAGLLAVPIRQNRMAHATEIKQRVAAARSLVVVEAPVSVRYSRETLAKGQRAAGAADIVRDLAIHYLFGESR